MKTNLYKYRMKNLRTIRWFHYVNLPVRKWRKKIPHKTAYPSSYNKVCWINGRSRRYMNAYRRKYLRF